MNRLAQLASSPLIRNYAFDRSQGSIRPEQKFLAPLCEVPTLTFRFKKFNAENRFKVPNTKRDLGGRATRVGFTATDASLTLEPNALDFPIPNVDGLSDQDLEFNMLHGTNILADAAGLSLSAETIQNAVSATTGTKATFNYATAGNDPIGDATNGLDLFIENIMKAVAGSCKIKVLFGTTAFRLFRNNPKVSAKFIVGGGRSKNSDGVGTVSPNIQDVSGLLFGNPDVMLATTVVDTAAQGVAENLSFVFDNSVLVFASNDTPNTFDPSFMKTFATMGGFFKPGTYMTEDNRDQVLKMDWTTLPMVTNATAGQLITMT